LFSLIVACALNLASARERVIVVVSDDLEAYTGPVAPFVAELGLNPEVISLHGREVEAKQAVERIGRALPDLVYCIGAKACYAVHKNLPKVPLVYSTMYEPARYGITGDQATGVTMQVEPVSYLSQFSGFFPQVKKVGVLRGPGLSDQRWLAIRAAGIEVDVDIVEQRVRSPKEVRGALVSLSAAGIDALWVPADRSILTADNFRTVSEECRRRQLPLLVDTANMVEAGGLFTLAPNADAVGRQAARLARRVLDGAAPSVIDPEDPETLHVVLNVRTIDRAGLPFDPLLLDFVDVVID